ncbi:MAG: CotH kinase family protein [Lachnospiraceae bacterium]|nr:CotH kinase family protein [Lachnospiraceae bacterium]
MARQNFRNRIRIILVGMIVLLAALVVIFLKLSDEDSIRSVQFTCSAGENLEESIYLYRDGEDYYLFLPGYADPGHLQITYEAGYSLYLDGVYYPSGSVCGSLQADASYDMLMKNAFGSSAASGNLVVKQGGSIAALSIHLTNGTVDELNSSKEVTKTGYFSLVTEEGLIDYYGELKEIHGRGNTTWRQNKKSYALELPVATDLLGMGLGENWVLLSNSFDESGLKNKLAFDLSAMIGAEYAVSSVFVDLYIDGVYYGEYLLAEKVEIGENRVNITNLATATADLNPMPLSNYDSMEWTESEMMRRGYMIPYDPDDITGGYLFQIEHHDSRINDKESLFQTNDLSFSVTSPKYASTEQISYISGYVQACEDAIKAGDLSVIDIDSFVDYYLVQEILANNDNCSMYLYKDSDSADGRLHMCAPWDFDLSMGNGWRNYDVNPEALYRNVDNWFDILCENEEFTTRLSVRYEELLQSGLYEQLDEMLTDMLIQTSSSYDMNKLRWRNVPSDDSCADESQRRFDSLDDQVSEMKHFLNVRLDFLRSAWIDKVHYGRVTFFSDYDYALYNKVFFVEEGSGLHLEAGVPVPFNDTDEFLGWYDEDGNAYDPETVMMEDITYRAAWRRSEDLSAKLQRGMDFVGPRMEKIITYGSMVFMCMLTAVILSADLIREHKKKRNKH